MRCQVWRNYGFVGRDGKTGGPCDQDLAEGENVCSRHLSERQYFEAQFASLMERATRHTAGVGIFGEGIWCGCGVFVRDGVNHPFSLPHRLEEVQKDLRLEPCPACAFRWQHPDMNINCGAGCDDGWVPLRERHT